MGMEFYVVCVQRSLVLGCMSSDDMRADDRHSFINEIFVHDRLCAKICDDVKGAASVYNFEVKHSTRESLLANDLNVDTEKVRV